MGTVQVVLLKCLTFVLTGCFEVPECGLFYGSFCFVLTNNILQLRLQTLQIYVQGHVPS